MSKPGLYGYSTGQTQYNNPQVVQAEPINANSPHAFTLPEGKVMLIEADVPTRQAFVRKVYTILSIQLLITFGFVALFTFSDSAKAFVQQNDALFFAAQGVSIFLIIVLSCCVGVARSHPWGLIFLFIFTLAESVIIGFLASFFDEIDVILAVGVTMLITFGLTLFACQTKYDFTGMGPYLFVILLVLILFGFVLIFVAESREVQLLFAVLGVIVFSMFLVFDTQLVIGGAHKKFQFDVDDYVFAALNLYLDIINLLLYLLIIFGGGDS